MRWRLVKIVLLLALCASLAQGTHFTRNESSESANTEYNLASTLTGNISSKRHHDRAHLNLYPDTVQQPAAGFRSPDIDEPAGHESGGNGIGTLGAHVSPSSNPQQPVGYPQYINPYTRQTQPPAAYPLQPAVNQPQPLPLPQPNSYAQPVPNIYPNLGLQFPSASPDRVPPSVYPNGYPGFGYPGQYLPQFPKYPQPQPQPLPVPVYPGYAVGVPVPGNVPVATHPQLPATSYQNQRHAAPGTREHWNRSFAMNTEYNENGVHKGPFGVLNNHNRPGYGSGYGGGYNGAFNSPGY